MKSLSMQQVEVGTKIRGDLQIDQLKPKGCMNCAMSF